MKTRLLIILCLGIFSANAQTTYDLDWYAGAGTNVNATINIGDTVRWTWTSPNHTVTSLPGSTETFDSGFLGPIGSTWSYTFTKAGTNPYYCEIHGAGSMSGTITVKNILGVDDEIFTGFKMSPNPSNSKINLKFPQHITEGDIMIFDLLGKELVAKTFKDTSIFELNISDLAQGFYLVKVKSGTSSLTKQLIKN